jgi:diphthine-ammonia ligase
MVVKNTAAVLFTGGKDSMNAIEILRGRGYDIACLVTVLSDNEESYMLHTAAIEITKLSSQALALPLFIGHTKGEKETELEDIASAIKGAGNEFSFDTIASGGIASSYQRSRIDEIAKQLGLRAEAPLWGVDQISYLQDLVSNHYRFILTSVSAEGLDRSWLGREIDQRSVLEIIRLSKKYGFNAAFEGGEAETLVLDCPLFEKERLRILDSEVDWRGSYGRLLIRKIELVPKEEEKTN